MPRTENQKAVAAYLPLELYDKLEQFKLEEGIKSDSKAINTILERWLFEEVPIPAIAKTNHLEERLSEVERICENLVEQITGLLHLNTVSNTVVGTIKNNVLIAVPDTVLSTTDDTAPSVVPDTVPEELPIISYLQNSSDTVLGTMYSTIDSNVPNTVLSTMDGTIHSTIDGTIDDNVPGTIHSTIDGITDSNVPNTVLSTMDGTIHSTIDGTIDDNVPGTIHSTINDTTDSNVPSDVPSTIDSNVPDTVGSELDSNLIITENIAVPLPENLSQALSESPIEMNKIVICAINKETNLFYFWNGSQRGFTNSMVNAKRYKSEGMAERARLGILKDDYFSDYYSGNFELRYNSVRYFREHPNFEPKGRILAKV